MKIIKYFPRFIKYAKVYQNHQGWVPTHLTLTISFLTKLNKPLLDPTLNGDSKGCSHIGTVCASGKTSCSTTHRSIFLSSGIIGHFIETPSTFWTRLPNCSSSHIQFAFQGFLQGTCTIHIPKAARGEFLCGSLPCASLTVQLVKNLPAMQEIPIQFLGREDPLEKGKTTHSSILA